MSNEYVSKLKKANDLADNLLEEIYSMDAKNGFIEKLEEKLKNIKEHYLQVFDVVSPNSEDELQYYLHFANFYRLLNTLLIEKGGIKTDQQYKKMIENGLIILEDGIKESSGRNKTELIKEKETYLDLLNETWQKHKVPKKGCYIATAVYGSYNCPQVWILRRYRDKYLSRNIFGRIFILIYYAISPSLVKWFGKSKWFTVLAQRKLDGLIEKLQNRGYDNTPYYD